MGQKGHDGDRWIAATAVRLEVPLVTHDAIFRAEPGVTRPGREPEGGAPAEPAGGRPLIE